MQTMTIYTRVDTRQAQLTNKTMGIKLQWHLHAIIITSSQHIKLTCTFKSLRSNDEISSQWLFLIAYIILSNMKKQLMIMVTPNDAANMKVDVMPLFFTEFSDGKQPVFSYKNSQFVEVLINISGKLLEHYAAKINTNEEQNPEPVVEALPEDVPEVTLFED